MVADMESVGKCDFSSEWSMGGYDDSWRSKRGRSQTLLLWVGAWDSVGQDSAMSKLSTLLLGWESSALGVQIEAGYVDTVWENRQKQRRPMED